MKAKRVLYDKTGQEFDEISAKEGQILLVDENCACEEGWIFAHSTQSGTSGILPVEFCGDATELYKCKALFDFESNSSEELSIISVFEAAEGEEWWIGSLNGQFGFIPASFMSRECAPNERQHKRESKEKNLIPSIDMESFLVQVSGEDPFLRYIEGSNFLCTEELMEMRHAFGAVL